MVKTFIDLDKNATNMLCFYAYYGEASFLSYYYQFSQHFKLSEQKCTKCNEILIKKGYLQKSYQVSQKWHIKVLEYLFTERKDLLEMFTQQIYFHRSTLCRYLSEMVECVCNGKIQEAKALHVPSDVNAYFSALIPERMEYLQVLSQDAIKEIITSYLDPLFLQDKLTEEILDQLEGVPSEMSYELRDQLSAYRFFIAGTPMPVTTQPTRWSNIVLAISYLYAGQVYEAIDTFKSALTVTCDSFDQPIVNYFYGLALYKGIRMSKDRDITKAYERFRASYNIQNSDDNIFIKQFFNYIDRTVFSGISVYTERILNSKSSAYSRTLCYMLLRFFDLAEADAAHLHSSAIMQYEASRFKPLQPDVRKHLHESYGGEPLLNTIRKKNAWEVALNDIQTAVKEQSGNGRTRVAYIFKDLNLDGIMLQQEYDGGWVDKELLSISKFINNQYLSLDDVDLRIAGLLKEGFGKVSDASIIVPLLKDSGRLFFGSYDKDFTPLVLTEEKPTLVFSGNGANIEVRTNVDVDSRGNIAKHTVRFISNSKGFTITSLNPLQKDIINRFLTVGTFPATAINSLRNATANLAGIVSVVEQNLDYLLQPASMSEGVLSVRIRQNDRVFDVQINATAISGGTGRYIPGEGDAVVYDEVDGITNAISRDLKREYDNYTLLHTFLKDELDYSFQDYGKTTIETTTGLLKLMVYVHDHPDRFFLEWPEGRPLKLKGSVTLNDVDIKVTSNEEWFKVQGEVKVAGTQLSLEELIRKCSGSRDTEFVKLGEDEYLHISDALRRNIAAFGALPLKGGKTSQVPMYQVGALAKLIEGLKVKTDRGYQDFLEKTKQAYATVTPVPEGLKAELRDYQKEGFQWMCRLSAWGAGACLADDMGLGKTLQAITFLLHKASEGPSLVVAPKSVIPNWVSEVRKFAPSLNAIVLNNESNREFIVEKAGPTDLVLCTYGVLTTAATTLKSRRWNVICLDEAHQIKNRDTAASRTAMELQSGSRLMLTGTPLQNNLGELWNLFQFLNPGLLGTWSSFRDNYINHDLDELHRSMLKEMTMPFLLRRTKQDVLDELPEKMVHEHLVELTPDEMAVYEKMRKQIELKFKKYKTKEERREAKELKMNFFAELTKLRLMSCSMRLVHDSWTAQSSKIEALNAILDNLLANPDNNVIVFSQFTSFLDMVKVGLKKKRVEFLYLDGQTPLDKRQQMVSDFQDGKCRLFISSLKAGGLGINLTAANYVILLDPWWNPAIESQAMDRAHRLGQKRKVSVIRLISEHTIEEKIVNLHKKKQDLSDEILSGTADSGKLTYEEIMDMVSPF